MVISRNVEILGAVLFALGIVHTFLTKPILNFSHRFAKGSSAQAVGHLLSEIELVFGFWGGLFILLWFILEGPSPAVEFLNSLHFVEPIFVFCIMVVASTKPILHVATVLILAISQFFSRWFRLPRKMADLFFILVLGPLLGSFITEPAAMTVSALMLNQILGNKSKRLLYLAMATLFVNVSIGGALTHFAAPPILMVAAKWNWNLSFVFFNLGWKSLCAVVVNAFLLVLVEAKEIKQNGNTLSGAQSLPLWVILSHVAFLVLIILAAHSPVICGMAFLLFLGLTTVTQNHQQTLRLREALLVALFLGGIILFGHFQNWWLQPLISQMDGMVLFLSSVALTSVTDNAALTYLGSQVSNLSELSKYDLVAGAIAGGGLTIIANAPNAAGFSILNHKFSGGFNPVYLFAAAVVPTLVAVAALQFL